MPAIEDIARLDKEYYTLFEVVNKFDERLMGVKNWSVTVSIASMATGFLQQHYGVFLVAAISGLGFWIIDSLMKRQQMRYYTRMRQIEIFHYNEKFDGTRELQIEIFQKMKTDVSEVMFSPAIDWSWTTAPKHFDGCKASPPEWYTQKNSFGRAWMFGHVALPHAMGAIAGSILFVLAIQGFFGDMKW